MTNSRPTTTGRVKRRRYCEGCCQRFTTIEVEVDAVERIIRRRVRRILALALHSASAPEQPKAPNERDLIGFGTERAAQKAAA